MKIKKIISAVAAISMLTSVVCSAAVNTTSTYDSTGKVSIKTDVTDLSDGEMVAFVLYGKGQTGFDANGVKTVTDATPTETNIIHIDQINSVTGGSASFTVPALDPKEVAGSKVIVGASTTQITNSTDTVDNGVVTYPMTVSWDDGIASATATYTYGTTDTVDSVALINNTPFNVPVGYDVSIAFTAADGKEIDVISGFDDVSQSVNQYTFKHSEKTGVTINATSKTATTSGAVTIDSTAQELTSPLTVTDDTNATHTLSDVKYWIIENTTGKTGLGINLKKNGELYIGGLDNMSDSHTKFAIGYVVDDSLKNDANGLTAEVYYTENDQKISFDNTSVQYR